MPHLATFRTLVLSECRNSQGATDDDPVHQHHVRFVAYTEIEVKKLRLGAGVYTQRILIAHRTDSNTD